MPHHAKKMSKIYTPEVEKSLAEKFAQGASTADLAAELDVSERSIIAKLSSMGLYKKKGYTTKRGEVPVKKSEYVERIAALLGVDPDLVESLEKVNKNVLKLLEDALT